jgi:hypothetical protein
MKVKSMILRESGEYNDLALRPYVADFDRTRVNQFIEHTDGGSMLQPKTLSSMAIGMLRPSTENCGIAPIASGWGERRFMFLMQVEMYNDTRQKGDMVLTGYTDYVGGVTKMAGDKVVLDPKMKLYFNSKFHLKSLMEFGSRGNQWGSSVRDSAQIITRTEHSDLNRGGAHGTMSMRPEDIIMRATTTDDYRITASKAGFRDTRAEFNLALKTSNRGNAQSSIYLSKSLSALRDAATDDYLTDNDVARLSAARGLVREPSITSDRIFEEMQMDSNIMRDGYITWRELCDMNPDVDRITDVCFNDKRSENHRRGDTANWGGSDNETMAATIIANTVPAFMTEAMYASIDVTMTNDVPGGQLETVITSLVGYVPDSDVESNYNRLLSCLERQLYQEILFNPDMTLSVRIRYSLYGETRIMIQYDNYPEAEFVYPSFCDSVASPVMSNDVKFVDDLSTAIVGLDRMVREGKSSSMSSRSSISESSGSSKTNANGRFI